MLNFAFPARHDLLFTHDFSKSKLSHNGHDMDGANALTEDSARLAEQWRPCPYTGRHEWEKELVRLNCKNKWRVTEVNQGFAVSES